jgi:hypothetical protein
VNALAAPIIELGAVATALVAIAIVVTRTLRKAMVPVKKLHYFLDDWFGVPARPGVPARLGVMARLDAIEHELHPNSSMSMRDAVDRIEQAVSIAPKIERIAAAVDGGESLHADPPASPPSA